MPPAPRQRSASEPNLFASIMDTNPATGMFYPDDLTLPSHQQQRMLPQEPVYLSPTSDNTVHAYSPPLGGYPASGSQGLRRAVSMTGGRPHSASDAAFLHPQYALPGDGGRVVRARSLGSSRGGSPYSRAASPSGSELSEGASSFGGYASDAASQASGHIAKQVVTTGPVAEASAIRRTHAAKFECDICGVHLTTKTNLDGEPRSLSSHALALDADGSFARAPQVAPWTEGAQVLDVRKVLHARLGSQAPREDARQGRAALPALRQNEHPQGRVRQAPCVPACQRHVVRLGLTLSF